MPLPRLVVRFFSPPAWPNPTPRKFLRLASPGLGVLQTLLPLLRLRDTLLALARARPAPMRSALWATYDHRRWAEGLAPFLRAVGLAMEQGPPWDHLDDSERLGEGLRPTLEQALGAEAGEGSGVRPLGRLPALEALGGRPGVASDTVLVWAVLEPMGLPGPGPGYGFLLNTLPSPAGGAS